MKKYIILIAIAICTININAQNTEGVVTKKGIFKKKKSKKTIDVAVVQQPIQTAARVANEPDTPFFRLNLIDTTTNVYKGNETRIVFKKNCDNCFRIDPLPIDTATSDKFFKKKYLITLQYVALETDVQGFRDYQKATSNDEPEIILLKKEIAERQRKIKAIQENAQKNKQ